MCMIECAAVYAAECLWRIERSIETTTTIHLLSRSHLPYLSTLCLFLAPLCCVCVVS